MTVNALYFMKTMRHRMPLRLRIKILQLLAFPWNWQTRSQSLVKEMRLRKRMTHNREDIPWHPSINHDLCSGCGKCVGFCFKSVYAMQPESGKPLVANPSACVSLCKGCESRCPSHAISFPKTSGFVQYIYYV